MLQLIAELFPFNWILGSLVHDNCRENENKCKQMTDMYTSQLYQVQH